jgi:hypothetical protein
MNNRIRKRALNIFSSESLEKLRKAMFNGSLWVRWKNGVIEEFDVKTKISFGRRNRDEFIVEDF